MSIDSLWSVKMQCGCFRNINHCILWSVSKSQLIELMVGSAYGRGIQSIRTDHCSLPSGHPCPRRGGPELNDPSPRGGYCFGVGMLRLVGHQECDAPQPFPAAFLDSQAQPDHETMRTQPSNVGGACAARWLGIFPELHQRRVSFEKARMSTAAGLPLLLHTAKP